MLVFIARLGADDFPARLDAQLLAGLAVLDRLLRGDGCDCGVFPQARSALAKRRMNAGATAEAETSQRSFRHLPAVFVVAAFVLSARSTTGAAGHPLPAAVSIAANALVLLGFTSCSTVQGQHLCLPARSGRGRPSASIIIGPYAIVRHPMYAGAFPMFLAIPLALSSWWGLVPSRAPVRCNRRAAAGRGGVSTAAPARLHRMLPRCALSAHPHAVW